jgi:hypothetical protein
MTEYVGIQRVLPASPLMFVADDIPENTMDPTMNHVRRGTGPMLTAVNGGGGPTSSIFGYAFVTGTAGNGLANIRVGGYQDSASNVTYPYANTTANADVSLPNNNGQRAYDADVYYNITAPGSYPLWAYANAIISKAQDCVASAAAQRSIFAAMSSTTPDAVRIVHSEGLTSISDMQVERNFYTSPTTGEKVTDGQRIVPLGTAVEVPPPDGDDPQLKPRGKAAKPKPMTVRKPRVGDPQR